MQNTPLVAYWTENGDVNITDLSSKYAILESWNQKADSKPKNNPKDKNISIKSFKNPVEGFALDWSFVRPGRLATGSCDGKIYIYNASNTNFSDW
jgi:ribosome assembly protein RRB1